MIFSAPDAFMATGSQNAPTLTKRLLCMVYESLLLFGVVFAGDYLFDTLTQSRHALTLRHVRQIWVFIVVGAYFVYFWTHGGQTLAMKTWRIRVVDIDGKALAVPRAIARYFLCWIFLLPTFALLGLLGIGPWLAIGILGIAIFVPTTWMLFDPDRQFLHDIILGTRLITV